MNKIDKKAVARSFSKAALSYDDFAQLQRDIGAELFKRTVPLISPKYIVDLGCGTGFFSKKLQARFPDAEMTCFDISPAMLECVQKRKLASTTYICGDIDDLPRLQRKVDLFFSNLVVQWSDDLLAVLDSLYAQLEMGGKVIFSTLLDGSLTELERAWEMVDKFPHINEFTTKTMLNEIIKNSQFQKSNIKYETRVLTYSNVVELMRALKGIGANHVNDHHIVKVSGKTLIKQLEFGYSPFKDKQGYLPLTYQVAYVELTK